MMVCICVSVPSLFTHVLRLCGTNLQRVALSSFPSSDINIWANAVRQLLVENPQQSLAVTTWECSSEGHALHCDYKQQSESGESMMPRSSCLACLCDVFCYATNIQIFFFPITIVRLHAAASTDICSDILIMIAKDGGCFMPFTL